MNLDLLTNIFHNLVDDKLYVFIYAGKFLGVLIFALTIGKKAFQSFSSHGIVLKKERDQEGLSPYDLVRGLLILALIVSLPEILTLVDKILLAIEQVGTDNFQEAISPWGLWEVEIPEPDSGNISIDRIFSILQDIQRNFNPMMWGLRLFYLAMYMVDVVLFTVFIAQRFFIMGVIKLLSPIILGLSILPQYKDLSYNLGKTYIRSFLMIIPYLFVFVFVNAVHDGLVQLGYTAESALTGMPPTGIAELAQRNLALLTVVILKIMLLKKSGEIMKQLI